MNQKSLTGESLTTSISASGEIISPSEVIGSFHGEYVLSEADFMRLTSSPNRMESLAGYFSAASVGYFLSELPKFLKRISGHPVQIGGADWIPLAAGVGLALIFLLIGKFIPNERSKLIKAINQHFRNAPRVGQIFKRDENA